MKQYLEMWLCTSLQQRIQTRSSGQSCMERQYGTPVCLLTVVSVVWHCVSPRSFVWIAAERW